MIQRILPSQLPIFSSFPAKEIPLFLDIQSDDERQISILRSLPENGLAVVGTRYPQRRSIELMEQTFQSLKGSNLAIISGFARGIDSRAHELALEYGLKTIAILGCGIEVDYPRENRHLKNKILAAGGLIISEFEPATPAWAGNFLRRNRLIAGFSRATWVVEGAAQSGTLNTANWATNLNRDLYATSCFPGDPFFQGNQKLLSEFEPNRYPLAYPFFGVQSLSHSWPTLKGQGQSTFELENQTLIQKWVTEIKAEQGACQIQTLMNFAYQKGLTPGKFYLEFEEEIQRGKLFHHPDGRVTIEPTP